MKLVHPFFKNYPDALKLFSGINKMGSWTSRVSKIAKQIENFIKSNTEKDVFLKMFTDDVQYTITNITLKEKTNLEEDVIGILEKDFKIDRKMLSIDYRDSNMVVSINKNTILGKENKILSVLENLFK